MATNNDDNRDMIGSDAESTDSKEGTKHGGDLSGEAAGVARGVARSVFRAPIGQLPRQGRAILTRQRLPVRQVARISDRMATGLDWLSTAAETTEGKDKLSVRAGRFALSMLKNTLLGLAVFESYGYLVAAWAPNEETGKRKDEMDVRLGTVYEETPPTETGISVESSDGDNYDDIITIAQEPDEYARASIPIHFVAGSVSGSLHGILVSIMEGQVPPVPKYTVMNTLHHSIAHSLLFGSYESIKRIMLQQIHSADDGTQYYGGAYLVAFALAGGFSGQLQHVASHYTEHWFGLANESFSFSIHSTPRAPAIRPLLWAFPPSAIGFVAFEYGKKFAT